MRPQRRREGFDQQPTGRIKHGQEMGHRETAARSLAAGLVEVGLEFGHIGHRGTGAVDQERAMATPQALVIRRAPERAAGPAEQGLEDLQGESLAGLAVGRGGEGLAGEVGDVLTGGVAADDLEQEEVDGDHGIELALAVAVSGLLTGLLDGLRPKEGGNVLSELLEDDRDPALDRETSGSAGV